MKIVCFGQLAVGLESITIPFTTHAVGDDRPPEGANPPSESARIPRARTYYVYNSKKKKKKTEGITMTTIVLTTTLIICDE